MKTITTQQKPKQLLNLDQMNECPCDCHPRCVCCQKCNAAYHDFPMPPDMRTADKT